MTTIESASYPLAKQTEMNASSTTKVSIMSEDFSKGKRGAIIKPDSNKSRITIRLDGDIIEYFKEQVNIAGGGNYQTLINDALHQFILTHDKSFEEIIRKVIREEVMIREEMKQLIRDELKLVG